MTSAQYAHNYADLKVTWRCPKPSCTSVSQRRGRNDNTPVGSKQRPGVIKPDKNVADSKLGSSIKVGQSKEQAVDVVESCENIADVVLRSPIHNSPDMISLEKFEVLIDRKLNQMRSSLTDTLKTEISTSTSSLSADIQLLLTNMSVLKDRVTVVESENAVLRDELAELKDRLKSSQVAELQESVNKLRAAARQRDQASLLNDVELTCIPEYEGESVLHIVTAAAQKLGVTLDEREVVSATRVGAPRGEGAPLVAVAEASGLPRKHRPRPIVVRLARRSVREELLKGAKVRRGTTTEGLGLPPHTPQKLHVNERLTKENRVLFAKAREVGKQWQFIWTRDGLVQARLTKTSKICYIRCEADLDRVFGNYSSPINA